MEILIAYVVFVGLGPVVFLALIRPRPSRSRFFVGGASAVMLMVTAWLMKAIAPGAGPAMAISGLGAMWLGWIVTIAMGVQAIELRLGRGRRRSWSAALGAAATVLPWFGLSLAVTAAG